MRILVLFGLYSLIGAVVSQAQQARDWCDKSSSYETVMRQNAGNLRWSLYTISQLRNVSDIGIGPPTLNNLIINLTDGSVSSLANVYSFRARFLQKCDFKEPKEYYREMADNERFIALLLAATAKMIAEVPPGITPVPTMPPATEATTIRLDGEIIKRITEYWLKKAEEPSESDPIWVAGHELMGETIPWSERTLRPLRQQYAINRGMSDSFGTTLGSSLARLEKSKWQINLMDLSGYYRLLGQ